MQMTPEPSAERLPRPALASEKIVGNMIELKRPIDSNAQPERAPAVFAETV
jgi:hypothetical protein